MSSIFYKVIFEETKEDSSDSYSLTFKDIFYNIQIQVSSQFFTTLRVLSQKESNVVQFPNIKEVIIKGNSSPKIEINYFISILYTKLDDGKKEGFLIGNIKNMGDLLIGIWPYNEENEYNSKEIYLKKLDSLTNSSKFNNICVVYPLK